MIKTSTVAQNVEKDGSGAARAPAHRVPAPSAMARAGGRIARASASIRKLVLEKAEIGARMHGVDRREFLASACGMATTLYVINMVNGCSDGKMAAPRVQPELAAARVRPAQAWAARA